MFQLRPQTTDPPPKALIVPASDLRNEINRLLRKKYSKFNRAHLKVINDIVKGAHTPCAIRYNDVQT